MPQLLAEFRTLYPYQKRRKINSYLKGIDKSTLEKVATYLIGSIVNGPEDPETSVILSNWFSPNNYAFAKEQLSRIQSAERRHNQPLVLISVISCLHLLQSAQEPFNNNNNPPKSKEQTEIDLFLALLELNAKVTSAHGGKTVRKQIKKLYPSKHRLAGVLLNISFPDFDILNSDRAKYTYCQTIKALLLFRFLEVTPVSDTLLNRFYTYYGINNWKEYFERILPIITSWHFRANASSVDIVLPNDQNLTSNQAFLGKLAMNTYTQANDLDFLQLRNTPLLPLDSHTFRIIHPLFVIDKIYKGLFFLLQRLGNDGPKTIQGNFRRWYTSEFTENVCLAELIKYSISSYDKLAFDKDYPINQRLGAPDCYLRLGNNIFLIENKDVYLNAKIKQSHNIDTLDAGLREKFLLDSKRAVGIGQIINNIKSTLNMSQAVDIDYEHSNVNIYPVLLIHDRMFDAPGTNEILDMYFQRELKTINSNGFNIDNVKPLIVMNIDALIECSEVLKEKKMDLADLLNAYHLNMIHPKREHYPSYRAYSIAYEVSMHSFADFLPVYLTQKLGPNWHNDNLLQKLMN